MISAASESLLGLKIISPAIARMPAASQPIEIQMARLDGYGGWGDTFLTNRYTMAATAAAGSSPCQHVLNSPSRQKYRARPNWASAYTPSAHSVTIRLSREKAGNG